MFKNLKKILREHIDIYLTATIMIIAGLIMSLISPNNPHSILMTATASSILSGIMSSISYLAIIAMFNLNNTRTLRRVFAISSGSFLMICFWGAFSPGSFNLASGAIAIISGASIGVGLMKLINRMAQMNDENSF